MLLMKERPMASTHQLYNQGLKAYSQTMQQVVPERNTSLRFGSEPLIRKTAVKTGTVVSPIVTAASLPVFAQTQRIDRSYAQLKESIITRGRTYARNPIASRRGFVAENFIAESYNVDATIQKSSDRAYVPESNADASPDIVYDHGNKEASVKYYRDSEASAKAQTNPKYADQTRLVPKDQSEKAKEYLEQLAKKNEAKGRTNAAEIQRDTAKKIDSKIKGKGGVESTELTKKQADKLAEAFKTDEHGNTTVDHGKIDEVLRDTGLEQKVRRAKLVNELKGLGIAAAIGFGVAATITTVVELAQSGIAAANFDRIVSNGAIAGVESAALSIASYGVNKATTEILRSLKVDLLTNGGYTVNFAAAGILSIALFSTYTYLKLKLQGEDTSQALKTVGKQAMYSLSVLAVSVIAQGIYGGGAGIIVSSAIGLFYMAYQVGQTVHRRRVANRIKEFSIEQYKPMLLENFT